MPDKRRLKYGYRKYVFPLRTVIKCLILLTDLNRGQKTYIQNPSQQYQNRHHHQINKHYHLHQQQLINVRYSL